ncbi:MAG TPA: metal ABC transporter substrate-binding protein, partial [Clostridia bacterium]|nr:metal ABC transporter substrate-binding protein [Clostridia bacterium]
SGCDLFIYVGGESDAWVDDALKEAVNKNMIVLNLMDILGERAKAEETVEGMQAEEEEGEAGEEPEYDEHVWLSLRNASVFCDAIAGALATLDPGNAETYRANCEAYIEKLGALDAGYESAVQNAKLKTVLFADRFPFRYLADDYGLTYYAAFVGCSAETEASFETVVFLAGKADELGLPAVLVIENSDGKIAKAIASNISNPDIPILTMDSMQSVTSADAAGGKTYLGIMQGNLETLRRALG